jgi:chromosome segregation ATPase
MSDETVSQLEKNLKISKDLVSRLSAELDVVKGSIKPLKEEIKVLNKQLEDKGSEFSKAEKNNTDLKSECNFLDTSYSELLLIKQNLESELEETKKLLNENLKENFSKAGGGLSEEAKQQLNEISSFLFSCYRDSQNVGVKTKIYKWRQFFALLTQ